MTSTTSPISLSCHTFVCLCISGLSLPTFNYETVISTANILGPCLGAFQYMINTGVLESIFNMVCGKIAGGCLDYMI